MFLKNRAELATPIVTAKFTQGQTTYQEVLTALSQKEAILAEARDCIVAHKKNAVPSNAGALTASEMPAPIPLTAEASELLSQYRLRLSRQVSEEDVLKSIVDAVYQIDSTDFGRPYLPEGLDEFVKQNKIKLLKDLHISLITATARHIEHAPLTPEAIQALKLDLWRRIQNIRQEPEQKKGEAETGEATEESRSVAATRKLSK